MKAVVVPLALALFLVSERALDLREDPAGPSAGVDSPTRSCKPAGPFHIELRAGAPDARRTLRLDLALEPLLDLERMKIEVLLPEGGELLGLEAPSGPARPGQRFFATALVRLPRGVPFARVEVVASGLPSGAGEPEWQASVETLRFGAQASLPLVRSGAELALDTPAVRRGGSR